MPENLKHYWEWLQQQPGIERQEAVFVSNVMRGVPTDLEPVTAKARTDKRERGRLLVIVYFRDSSLRPQGPKHNSPEAIRNRLLGSGTDGVET